MQGLLNLLFEAIVPQRSPGLNRGPDIMHLVWIQRASEQFPVGITPCFLILAERQIQGVRRQYCAGLPQPVGAVARPAVMRRVIHNRRAHRVQLDVALASEQIGFDLAECVNLRLVPAI